MKLIIKGTREGKTTEAIKLAASSNAYLVVMNRNEAGRVFHEARDAGIDIHFPVTFDEFMEGRFSPRGCKAFVIDNADMLLERMGRGVPIVAATMNGPQSPNDVKEKG